MVRTTELRVFAEVFALHLSTPFNLPAVCHDSGVVWLLPYLLCGLEGANNVQCHNLPHTLLFYSPIFLEVMSDSSIIIS